MPGYEQPKAEWLADDGPAAVRSCFGTIFAATIIRVVYGAGFAPSSPIPDDAFIVDLGEIAAMRGTGVGEW